MNINRKKEIEYLIEKLGVVRDRIRQIRVADSVIKSPPSFNLQAVDIHLQLVTEWLEKEVS